MGNVCLALLIFQMSLTLRLPSLGFFQMQTIVLLISGSSYIRPGAVERSGEGSVCGHGSVGPDCGFDSDTWSGAVLCQGEH